MGLTKLAITRPVFILMLMCLAMFGGIFAIGKMRQEENPEVQFGVITVSTVYPGAGPEEVSTLVSREIEESVSGVNGLLEVTSTSQEGISVVVANFEIGTNMDIALNDVRSRVDSVLADLPRDILKPSISKIDGASDPVLNFSVVSDKMDPRTLRDFADDKLRDRFARVSGVAQVSISGGLEREIQVRVKKDRLLSYGVGINDIQRAISASTLNVPSGRITTDGSEYSVRVLGEYKTPRDLEDTIIRISEGPQSRNAASVRLGDIAEIVDTSKEVRDYSRVDGKDALVITVQKSREANTVDVVTGAKAVMAQLTKEQGLEFKIVEDKSIVVKESVTDLLVTLLIGIVLVTLIVYIFLHNLRGTMIVAIAIPICLLATFIVLALLGFTINNMSLLALSLAIGVLVDDSIVVLENIFRHLERGEDPRDAAINGRGEIGLAAIAITLADVVVFLPMGFMGGVVGQFFKPLGIGFAVAVMLSLFVSFTVTPMLASRWYQQGDSIEHNPSRFATWFNRGFRKLENRYARMLEWSLNHRWFVFGAGFVSLMGVFSFIRGSFAGSPVEAITGRAPTFMMFVMIGIIAFAANAVFMRKVRWRALYGPVLFGLTFFAFGLAGYGYHAWKQSDLFKFEFAPASDQGVVTMQVELAPESTLNQTLSTMKGLEKTAMDHPDVESVSTQVGVWTGAFGGGGGSRGANIGQIRVKLKEKFALLESLQFWVPHDVRYNSDTWIANDLIAKVGKVPGAKVTIAALSGFGFGAPIQMSFTSDDDKLLQTTAGKIRDWLASGEIKGVISPEISQKPGKPEIRAIPDRQLLADNGLTVADLAGSMRMLYEGNDDTKLRILGREYPIRVMMDDVDRNNPDLVDEVPIAFNQNAPVYLSQVAELEDGVTVDKVERRNRQREITVTAYLSDGYAAGTVQAEITQKLKTNGLVPAGVAQKELGQADVQARESQYLMVTIMIGLVLVYVVLASLYDNLLYPFIIQLAQPQAFVGGLLALVITDKSLNIVGFIGLIALVGLVGKNAILLVDYANQVRARGQDRHDALVESGRTRLRPILMTTLAIILGMLPVALAIGRGSEFRETIGIIIIGGVSLSTLLTLLVIPCSYTIFDDLTERIGSRKLRVRRRSQTEQLELPELEAPVGKAD